MSLNIQDLGIAEDVLEVIDIVSAGNIHFFKEVKSESNPFAVDTGTKLERVGSTAFISFRDGTIQNRLKQTEAVDGVHTVKIGLPSFNMQVGQYAYVNFSEEVREIQGVVTRINYNVSSVTLVEVDTRENIPDDLEVEARKLIQAQIKFSS